MTTTKSFDPGSECWLCPFPWRQKPDASGYFCALWKGYKLYRAAWTTYCSGSKPEIEAILAWAISNSALTSKQSKLKNIFRLCIFVFIYKICLFSAAFGRLETHTLKNYLWLQNIDIWSDFPFHLVSVTIHLIFLCFHYNFFNFYNFYLIYCNML